MANDFVDERTMRILPVLRRWAAGHSGHKAFTVLSQRETVSRKVRSTVYGELPSCSVSPAGPSKAMRAVRPRRLQLFHTKPNVEIQDARGVRQSRDHLPFDGYGMAG